MKRKAARPSPPAPSAAVDGTRRTWFLLLASAAVPVIVHVILDWLQVPLGCPGRLVYLYSPLVGWRLSALPTAILLAGALGFGVWLAAADTAPRRRAGLLLVALGTITLAIWTYFAPPDYYDQHVFNAHSPSHDGAFVQEALHVKSVGDYLRAFPERARTPPEIMRGTRVISNPPGATLLAVGARNLLQRFPALMALTSPPPTEAFPTGPDFEWFRQSSAVGLVFFWLLIGLWICAVPLFYLTGRLFWPPFIAAAFAACCVISPATLLFTPGKDPAQLLTVALPLYLWLAAIWQRRGWAAALAGAAVVLACLASLVHIWLGGVVIAATWFSTRGGPAETRRTVWRSVVYAGGGAFLAAAALYFFCGFNLLATARAVAQAQGEVTRGAKAMPLAWQLLGVPLFLLFAGCAWWTTTLWSVTCPPADRGAAPADPHDDARRFGRYLLLFCAVVMLATVGFTNLETPRLWIPFTPLLLLGALLQIDALRNPTRRVALLLAILVGAQVACAGLQWALMDMREAEMRLREGILFG